MTPNDDLLKQLIEAFNTELESLLLPIINNLNLLRDGQSVGSEPLLMEEISRSGRNIKVSALSIGINDLGSIAECIEQLFAPGKKISVEVLDSTATAVEIMRDALSNFIEKKPASDHAHKLVHQLQQLLGREPLKEELEVAPTPPANTPPPVNNSDDDFLTLIVETFKIELQENLITITEGLLALEKGAKSEPDFQNILAGIFRVAHNIKGSARGIGALHVGEIGHHLETLFADIQKGTVTISPEIINLCLKAIDYMNEAMRCYSEKIPLSFNLDSFLIQLKNYTQSSMPAPSSSTEISAAPATEKYDTDRPHQSELQSTANEFDSIRVSLHNLDRISVYMEEIQSIKIAIDDYYAKLIKLNFKMDRLVHSWKKNVSILKEHADNRSQNIDSLFTTNSADLSEINAATHTIQRELRRPVDEFSTLFNGLQDEVRTLRLVPVSTQLRNLPRIVRDLSQELKKEISIEINSNNIKIDKMILDGLKDPIIHVLRNAIDHGVESPEVRKLAGKSPQGTITIDVNQEDNQIVFKISDDGAGINAEAVSRIALQKKIISEADLNLMKQEDIYDLIFRPGFSTKTVATDISGRGVGMDVVRSNLFRLNGQVTMETHPGKGTTFYLHVPLTLSTERGLIISCASHVFAISTSTVEKVLLLKKHDVITVEGCPSVLVNEQPVLLCSLAKILHFDESKLNLKELNSVVVIQKNENRIALLVDEIIGEKEIVLKPLQEPLSNIPCVIGATLTGNNHINFVLNSSELIKTILP